MSLTCEIKDQILFIRFLRPEAGNSFGIETAKSLNNIISSHKKSARGLIFSSQHPRLFCAGGDLKAHQKMKSKKEGLTQAREIRTTLASLAKWPIPKAAFVNGDCFGGGMELLSCFDHRVATADVMFGFWQRRIALSFGWGGFERWNGKIDADVIKDLALSARVFGAREAMRLGVLHQIGDFDLAEKWIRDCMKWTHESGAALTAINAKDESRTFEKMWWSSDHRAIIKKFR